MTTHEMKEKLDKADTLLRQFPKGIRIRVFAAKLGTIIRGEPYARQTGYDYLNSLVLRGKARFDKGIAYPVDSKLEKETFHVGKGFLDGCFTELEKISYMSVNDDQMKALKAISHLVWRLPKCRDKKRLMYLMRRGWCELGAVKKMYPWQRSMGEKAVAHQWVQVLMNEISNWLHSKAEKHR